MIRDTKILGIPVVGSFQSRVLSGGWRDVSMPIQELQVFRQKSLWREKVYVSCLNPNISMKFTYKDG